MLDDNYNIRLVSTFSKISLAQIDFGDANFIIAEGQEMSEKDIGEDDFNPCPEQPRGTFVGTPLYVAPEMV